MRKLKLESLEIESFETTPIAQHMRGTVDARQIAPGGPHPLKTYNPQQCGETQYFDCSLGCPSIAPCDTEICA